MSAEHGPDPRCASDVFGIDGRRCITDEPHLGVKGAMLTTNVTYRDVLSLRGLWAPPYSSSNFRLQVRLCGETIPTEDYRWNGNECRRWGRLGDLSVESDTIVPMDRRLAVIHCTVTNHDCGPVDVPVQIDLRGGAEYVSFWEFQCPDSAEEARPWSEKTLAWQRAGEDAGMLVKAGDGASLAIATDLPSPRWTPLEGHWEAEVRLEGKATRSFLIACAMGDQQEASKDAVAAREAGEQSVLQARSQWQQAAADLFERMPRLSASDPRLVSFYNRSLVHLLLNQWHVPEFVLDPYYSTGGVNGGCVCCYLWDFGEPWEILALYDPDAVKRHIAQFLAVDITRHFAFVPVTGEPFGPWYPVNQEKIIFLVYYYVLLTGDTGFLHEQIGDKRVVDWVVFHAMLRDDPDLPVALIDYGKGNNHLELRGAYRYDHYLPDLNARRWANYMAAHELARIAGVDAEYLPQRAHALKALVKEKLWSPEHRWFSHLDESLKPDLRYTVQMFKLLGSGVLDDEQAEGLLGHLNEKEFLSAYGLHSMSKLDEAYDQVDIDNGGGGNYTAFTPQIIERLYRIGRVELAEDILRRVLWWGERMPYWGDSIVANNIDYRRDTPLQNTIGALAGAQCILFGMFGLQASGDGALVVNPQPPSFCDRIGLTGLKVHGREIDIDVRASEYRVTVDGQSVSAQVGTPVAIPTHAG